MPSLPPLTAEQRDAVRHGTGPALVLGGPGTGKTVTAIARFRHLVEEIGLPPGEVVLATPVPHAAGRLRQALGVADAFDDPRLVAACQSLAERFLAEILTARGEAADLQLLEGRRRRAVLRLLQVDWRHGETLDVLDVIRRRKAELLSPAEWLELLRVRDRSLSGGVPKVLFEACDVYFRYQEYLTAQGLLDREDVLVQCVALLRQPRTAALWDRRIAQVLVDDAQNLSRAELTFLRLVLRPGGVLWVAGDDDQALLDAPGWQPLAQLQDALPEIRSYPLPTCHRCTAQALEPALRLIRLNTHRSDKPVRPTRVSGKAPAVVTFPDAAAEAAWLAQYLLGAQREGVDFRHLAVLARLPEPLSALHETLAGVLPVDRLDVAAGWAHPIGAAYAAFVQMALDIDAGEALAGAEFSPAARQRCRTAALEARGLSFPQACIAARNHVASGLQAAELSAGLANELHLLDVLHVSARGFADVMAFLEHVAERRRPRRAAEQGVTLSTFAAAAGREWAVAVIVAMEDGEVPYDRGSDLEAERRQLFLGLTRSRQVVTLCLARRRGGLARSPSSFFFDLGANLRRVRLDDGA